MAFNLDLSTSEGVDVLMVDPFLDYINNILMEEGMDDGSVENASYQAIFSGFQDILCEPLLSTVYGDCGSHDKECDLPFLDQSMFCFHENGLDEHHFKVASSNVELIDELHNNVRAPRASLPRNDHPPSSFQQGMVLKSKTSLPSSGKDMVTQNLHGRPIMDAVVCSDMDIPIQKHRKSKVGLCMEQGHGKVKMPSAGEEIPSELDLSFEDLKLDDVYTSLYVAGPHTSLLPGRSSRHIEDKQNFLAAKGRKFHGKHRSEAPILEDVREVLISCAQAVATGNAGLASELLQIVRQVHGASADGTCLQRLAHYFSNALATRLRGTGYQEVVAMAPNMPPAALVLRALKMGYEVMPYDKILYYFANQSILKAAEGASKLHIVDYGLMYGMQWPCLIKALADRKGGPPLLVITGIESARPGINIAVERLDRSGQRLAAYAKMCNVLFQFHAIVTNKWEDLDAASLYCSESEVLVVNCMKRLRHISDDGADATRTSSSPRQKWLTRIHSLNPHLLIVGPVTAALCSAFFVTRFREALYFYWNMSDMLETICGDMPEKLLLERSWWPRDIVNIVACEGAERVERPDMHKQWHAHITKAGFELLPIPSMTLARSKAHVKQHYHKDFLLHDDGKGWMLMGWKGRTTVAISAWKPSAV